MAMKKVSFNLDEDLHFKAKELALKQRTTVTEIYTKWITARLKKKLNNEHLINVYKSIIKIEIEVLKPKCPTGLRT